MKLQISQNELGWTCQKKLQNIPAGLFLLAFGLGLIIVGLLIFLVGYAFVFSFSTPPPTLGDLLSLGGMVVVLPILLFGFGFIAAGLGALYYGVQCFNRYIFHIDNQNILHFSVQPIATSKGRYLPLTAIHSWQFSPLQQGRKAKLLCQYQDENDAWQELFRCDAEDFTPEECKVLLAALTERSRR